MPEAPRYDTPSESAHLRSRFDALDRAGFYLARRARNKLGIRNRIPAPPRHAAGVSGG